MFEFNKEISSSDNVHSKTTYDSGYFEDFVYNLGLENGYIQYLEDNEEQYVPEF